MKKFASFIVNHSKLILFIFIPVLILCGLARDKVNIEYSITSYLPADTDTKKGLDIMDNEFVTYGTSTFLIRNITFDEANELKEEIIEIEGVKDLPFENTEDYYKSSSALFTITYDGTEDDQICVDAYNKVLELVSPYDTLVKTSLVDTYADDLASDINKILVMVVAIIVLVLAFTSKSFAEVLVFLIVFGSAALLNMGTNFIFGTISFISNSVCVILQLALAIDYAIILSQRFAEEKAKGLAPKEALTEALSKAIVEIAGSSLTTISGLLALCCMTLKLGQDMGLVLAKSIICSMLAVFFFMPSIILLFTKWIDKTTHKDFVPKITGFSKLIFKLRYVLPPVFLVLVIVCAVFSNQLTYSYAQSAISTSKPTDSMIASTQIKEIFGSKNQFVILVPKDDYKEEKEVVNYLKTKELVSDITCISNVEITNNNITHTLVDPMNYKDFALFLGTDDSTAKSIYLAYAYLVDEDSSKEEVLTFEANPDIYTATLLSMCDTAFSHDDFIKAAINNEEDVLEKYEDIRDQITDAEDQLIGTNYTRIVFNIDAEIEDDAAFNLIDEFNSELKSYHPNLIFAGDSMNSYDLNSSFSTDNLLISILTIVFVYLILMLTSNSYGLPLLQVATIQGAIFINFAIPAIQGINIYFFVYLIVSSIQMGATIDYAIVITNRYTELVSNPENLDKNRKEVKKQAIIDTLNQAFGTILTSGSIMIAAGYLIYFFVKDPLISTLGQALGRGTVISILSVMCVLPLFLYFFADKLLKLTLPKIDTDKYKKKFKKIKKNNQELGGTLYEEK